MNKMAMPDKCVSYKSIGETRLLMDLFLPDEHDASAKAAGIVFFFGGGWIGGARSQFYQHCRYLASRGMVAMSAEYRVAERHGTTPFDCVADGKSAMRWIRLHAAELGIDPGKLAAGGASAGGHVAGATAMLRGFEDENDDRSVSARPVALVLFNPVFDNGPGGYGHDRVAERWQEFSLLHNVAAGAPPTLIFLGGNDKHIPESALKKFKDRMDEVNVRCDAWIYPGMPHGFFNYGEGNNPYYEATLFEADKFLCSLGLLDGEPTLPHRTVQAVRL